MRHDRGEAVPALIAVLEDEELGASESPAEGWPPIHVVTLLAELEAPEAIEPMLEMLVASTWEEILYARLVVLLPNFGLAVMDPALALLDDAEDPAARKSLCCVLSKLFAEERACIRGSSRRSTAMASIYGVVARAALATIVRWPSRRTPPAMSSDRLRWRHARRDRRRRRILALARRQRRPSVEQTVEPGNVYVGGTSTTVNGAGNVVVAHVGRGAFVARLAPSGALLSAAADGTSASGAGIAADALGNVFAAGTFTGTIKLGGVPLTSVSFGDEVYVTKLSL